MLLFLSTVAACENQGNDWVFWLFVKIPPVFCAAYYAAWTRSFSMPCAKSSGAAIKLITRKPSLGKS